MALNASASAGADARHESSRWRNRSTGTRIAFTSPTVLALPVPPSLPSSTPDEITAASGNTADCLVKTLATANAPRLVPMIATGRATCRAAATTAATSCA